MDDIIRDFVAESREGIEALDAKLVAFEKTPHDPALLGDIFRLIHSIKGASGFLGLNRLQGVAHSAENVLGAFRDGQLTVGATNVSAVLEAVDTVRGIIEALAASGAEPAGDDRALIARLDAIFAGVGVPASGETQALGSWIQRLGNDATLDAAAEALLAALLGAPAHAPAFAGHDLDLLQAALRDALIAAARSESVLNASALFSGVLPSLGEHGVAFAADRLRLILVELEAEPAAVAALLPETATSSTAEKPQPAQPPSPVPTATTEAETGGPQTIRVHVEVLEGLMTTVSELVLIRNQLIQTLRSQPDTPFAGPLNRLNQVTSELQESVMTTRMQPISGAWAKLPRLVRDLAADLGKSIELVATGQDTELDRQVLELIKDPLTHMIRNAADHGLERPDERRAAGKPETGRITLQARHEGGAIIVEMADDGRGLPAETIRAKALAKGLITQGQAAAMSDAEARQLIFLPGLSTADQITAVSGRGVGMDVVRTNIEKIGGVIELSSVEGQGTRFTIRIPLTLSIVSGVIVECCGERFAMPQAGIVELVSAGSAEGRRVEEINGAAVLRLRDRLLPLVSLQTLLGLAPQEEARTDGCIVVARVGGFLFGVLVDKVFDTEEIVVKPVASILRHLKIYSGATILGDGSVIMILDFKGMAQEAGAGALLNGSERDGEDQPLAREETQALLLFRAGEGSTKAAPLARVARIEETSAAALERSDGRSVLQYRGRLMPVVGVDAQPIFSGDARSTPLLVFTRGDSSIGLKVDEIVDIVDAPVANDLKAGAIGSRGSLIVAGQATELIDIDFFWSRAHGEPEPVARAAAPQPAAQASPSSPLKRLLVIDASPFTQMLLRPLLAQAGYAVEIAGDPEGALIRHEAGEVFDLIMADTSPQTANARKLATALGRATRWHATPLLGLGAHKIDVQSGLADFAPPDQAALLAEVSDTLEAA